MSLSNVFENKLAATKAIAARTALVIETNNLRGGDAAQKSASSLRRLLLLLEQQALPPAALAQVVITHDGWPNSVRADITASVGYPIDFVSIDAHKGYYEAKNIGHAATDANRCDYVVFADSDCLPDGDWLAELLAPLAEADPPVGVAGRTSYAPSLVGIALTTIDFMYFPSPLAAGATRNFYANNVVFRRDVFAHYSYQKLDGVYRAHCQMLGLRLQAARVPLRFAPRAHTVHRLPDTRREGFKLRWMRGQDSYGLTPHLVRAYLPRRWQWLGRSGPLGPMCVLVSRLSFSLRALNRQHLPTVRGGRWLLAAGLIVAFSAVDMLGAVVRGLGIQTVGEHADAQALSYHRS